MFQKLAMFFAGIAIAFTLAVVSLGHRVPPANADQHGAMPSTGEVCAIVTTLPSAEDTDTLLDLLQTDRAEIISNLDRMKTSMGRYDAEGYGWQNVLDSPGADEPQPGAWMIGALRMACEPQPAATVTGTVTYRQRIALPPDATVVVKLEDISRADAPAIVIAEKTISTAGQQVPIPFKLVYDPADIESRNRYGVRAQIFYGDQLRWTSTTTYSVITQGNPTEVEIEVQQI